MDSNRLGSIHEVIQIIRDNEKKHGIKFGFFENKFDKIFICIPLFSYISGWIIALIRPTDIYFSIVAIILWLFSYVFYSFDLIFNLIIPSFKRFFKLTDSYLEKTQKTIEVEAELIKNIADIETSTHEQTIKRLGYEIEFLEGRNEHVTGMFQKLAIVPAVVLLYIAYSKKDIPDGLLITFFPYLFAIFVGLCIGVFLAHGLIDRLKLFILIIESAKVKAEIKSSLEIQQ